MSNKKNPWIGVAELCSWIASETQRPCPDITTSMKDGALLAALLARVFPSLATLRTLKPSAASDPWSLVDERARFLGLPQCLCDWKGMQAGKFGACYAVIVAVFFVHHLVDQADYSADFAHDIPAEVSAFLQSMACVQVMVKGGALSASALGIPETPPPGGDDVAPHPTTVRESSQASPELRSLTDRFETYKVAVRHDGLQRESTQLRAHVHVLQQLLSQHGIECPLERPTATWPDVASQVRGEFLLKKLRGEVDGVRSELAYEREAMRDREGVLNVKMGAHRIAWLEHQERQRRQSAEDLEGVRQGHIVEMNAARGQHHKALAAVLREVDAEYEQFLHDADGDDPQRLAQELITLRKMRSAQTSVLREMEERTAQLAQQVTSQREGLKEMLRSQSAALDTLYHSLLALLEEGTAPPCDEKMVQAIRDQMGRREGLAATNKVLAENESLKRRVHELDLLQSLPTSAVAEIERNVFMHSELETMRHRVANLMKTNEFLSQQGGNTGSGGGGTVSSSVTGDLSQLSSSCYNYVQQVGAEDAFRALLMQSFWALVAHCGAVQRKGIASATNLELVMKENNTLRTQVAAAKVKYERDTFDSKLNAQTDRERMEAAASAERSTLSAEVQILKTEVGELREQAKQFGKKYKAVMQAAAAENDAQYDTIRARHRQATRALTSAKVRESLYRQALDVQRRQIDKTVQLATAVDLDAAGKLDIERQMLETEVASCVQRIQASVAGEGAGDAALDQLDGLVREATQSIGEQRDTALVALEQETTQLQKERARRMELESRLTALDAKTTTEANVIASLEHAVQMASSDRATVLRDFEDAQVSHHAEVRRLQSRLTEFEVMAAEAPALAKLAPPATTMQMRQSVSVDRRASPSPLAPSPTPNASQQPISSPFYKPAIASTNKPEPMLAPEIAEARKRISAVLAQRGAAVPYAASTVTTSGAPGATPQRFTMDEIEEKKRHFMSLLMPTA